MDSSDMERLGTRWLHFWFVVARNSDRICLAIQTETVGIEISGAPYVLMRPTDLRVLMDRLEQCEGAVRDDEGVSIYLGE